ncbi:MAG: hypothetical protein CVV23_11960 [Ignavibacteriae bacterium HGW-Ignavibacteriae-2]|jgi:two-component system response regulator NreC|nr:response regulator transcription factor [Bacteroidota bacterium]PKL88101.1 MAG: hypothetical protein CVV23_11960 [Ignavibacteriae bacterium HGW-Ignavibacteriae-2]
MIRILFADDHKLFREGIVSLLDGDDRLCIVAEAENGKDLLNKYFEVKPEVVLCDISMPMGSGPEIIKKIRNKGEEPKVLFLSMHTGEEYIYYTLKSGGLGLISKSVMKGELVNAIIQVSKGRNYFTNQDEETLKAIVDKYSLIEKKQDDFFIDPLTPKELEVLELVGEGLTSNEIADKLEVSKRTIDAHRAKIMEKLNLKTLPAFIKYAVEYKQKMGY